MLVLEDVENCRLPLLEHAVVDLIDIGDCSALRQGATSRDEARGGI